MQGRKSKLDNLIISSNCKSRSLKMGLEEVKFELKYHCPK